MPGARRQRAGAGRGAPRPRRRTIGWPARCSAARRPRSPGSAAGSSSSSHPTGLRPAARATSPEGGVAAAIVEERMALAGVAADHPADDDRVVAAGIGGEPLALDVGQRAVQQDLPFGARGGSPRRRTGPRAGRRSGARAPPARSPARSPRILGARRDEVVQLGRVVHAHRDQRRLERDRGQAARRHARRLPSGPRTVRTVTPGREAAEELAEAGGSTSRPAQSSILARNSGLSTSRAGTKSPVTPIKRVRHARAPAQPRDRAIEQRGEQHAVPDQPLDRPLAGEGPPASAAIRRERPAATRARPPQRSTRGSASSSAPRSAL